MGQSCRVAATFCSLDTFTLHDSIANRDLSNRERDASIAPEDSRPAGREIRRVRSLGARQRATTGSRGAQGVWGCAHAARAKLSAAASTTWLETAIPRSFRMPVGQPVSSQCLQHSRCADHSPKVSSLSRQDLPSCRGRYDISIIGGALHMAIPGGRSQSGRLHMLCLCLGARRDVKKYGPEPHRCSRAQHTPRPCEVIYLQ